MRLIERLAEEYVKARWTHKPFAEFYRLKEAYSDGLKVGLELAAEVVDCGSNVNCSCVSRHDANAIRALADKEG